MTDRRTNVERLRELALAVTKGRDAVACEFTMRVPAEPERDADLVLSTAAIEIEALRTEVERLREQLRLAVIDQAIAEAEANDVRCMAEDAARYRWLKKSAFCNVWERGDGIALVVPRAAMSDIDSRIDAAMEASNTG